MDNPYPWLQDFINQVPEFIQPLMVAVVAAIPYVEGEGAAALGILAGINPLVAALAAAVGNVLCVIVVVLFTSRMRGGVVARRSVGMASSRTKGDGVSAPAVASNNRSSTSTAAADVDGRVVPEDEQEDTTRQAKGRTRLRRWLVRFGVPGASILAPVALPTMLTAAFFVASGVRKEWVILWQIVAVVLWTGAVAAAATGVLALLGW